MSGSHIRRGSASASFSRPRPFVMWCVGSSPVIAKAFLLRRGLQHQHTLLVVAFPRLCCLEYLSKLRKQRRHVARKWMREWSWRTSPSVRFTRRKGPRYRLNRRLGEPQRRSGRFGEETSFMPRSGIEPRTVHPVVWSLYRLRCYSFLARK
jgi:hypothetical protein